jgi:hypothetical protein
VVVVVEEMVVVEEEEKEEEEEEEEEEEGNYLGFDYCLSLKDTEACLLGVNEWSHDADTSGPVVSYGIINDSYYHFMFLVKKSKIV